MTKALNGHKPPFSESAFALALSPCASPSRFPATLFEIEHTVTGQDFRHQCQDYVRQTSGLKFPEGNHIDGVLPPATSKLLESSK